MWRCRFKSYQESTKFKATPPLGYVDSYPQHTEDNRMAERKKTRTGGKAVKRKNPDADKRKKTRTGGKDVKRKTSTKSTKRKRT